MTCVQVDTSNVATYASRKTSSHADFQQHTLPAAVEYGPSVVYVMDKDKQSVQHQLPQPASKFTPCNCDEGQQQSTCHHHVALLLITVDPAAACERQAAHLLIRMPGTRFGDYDGGQWKASHHYGSSCVHDSNGSNDAASSVATARHTFSMPDRATAVSMPDCASTTWTSGIAKLQAKHTRVCGRGCGRSAQATSSSSARLGVRHAD